MHAIIRSSSICSLSSHSRSCMMFSSSCWKSVMTCNAFLLRNISKVSFKKFRKKSMHWLRALWKTWLKRCSTSSPLQYSRMSDRKVYQPIPWAVIFWTKREQLVSSKTWPINWPSLDRVDWNTFAASDGENHPLKRARLTRVFCSYQKQTSRQKFVFSSLGQL